MANTPYDSIYGRERTYFLNNLECQVYDMKIHSNTLPRVLDSLGELHTMTNGCIEMAALLEDHCFEKICRDLQPILAQGIAVLREDGGAVTRAIVADHIEGVVPLSVRDPIAWGRMRAAKACCDAGSGSRL
ncbi:uncharacterized protein N7529_007808 [Penicillium soppii]|uniref:uncharacterized protein n=1 Tax=Penicillium soppii TaxID=69789 RepID=UPI002546B4C6|nr:uncharacterized protein N7529_007808 [Penicillium soppii]KAJ5860498.1 hypothetical protein N7529_007808 [Penicillium soppii]